MIHYPISLHPYVDALLEAGFDVDAPHDGDRTSYVVITRSGEPGCVLMQEPSFPRLGQMPILCVPVRPSVEVGSSVLLDLPFTEPADLPAALLPVLRRATVRSRFIEPERYLAVRDARPSPRRPLNHSSHKETLA